MSGPPGPFASVFVTELSRQQGFQPPAVQKRVVLSTDLTGSLAPEGAVPCGLSSKVAERLFSLGVRLAYAGARFALLSNCGRPSLPEQPARLLEGVGLLSLAPAGRCRVRVERGAPIAS